MRQPKSVKPGSVVVEMVGVDNQSEEHFLLLPSRKWVTSKTHTAYPASISNTAYPVWFANTARYRKQEVPAVAAVAGVARESQKDHVPRTSFGIRHGTTDGGDSRSNGGKPNIRDQLPRRKSEKSAARMDVGVGVAADSNTNVWIWLPYHYRKCVFAAAAVAVDSNTNEWICRRLFHCRSCVFVAAAIVTAAAVVQMHRILSW